MSSNYMNQKTKYLIGKWGKRIALAEKVQGVKMSYEKKAALANILENTSDRIRAVEATNPGSIGQYKKYALDVVTAAIPNTIAFDLVAVQAMDNRSGMINYINYNYTKAKGGVEAGQTFMSSVNVGKSDLNYTSDRVKDEIIGVGNGEKATFAVTLPWAPVILDSFTVEAGDVIGACAADGTVTGTGVSGTLSAGGALTLTFTSAPASGVDIVVNYRFRNEDVTSDGPTAAGFTNVPEMELKLESVPVNAVARTLRTYWSFDAQYELQKEYGSDIETLLATQATGEIAHEIDQEITNDLFDMANAAAPLTWSKTITPGISLVEHYDSFKATLVEGQNRIFQATQKVRGNYMVCGINVSNVVEVMTGFQASGIEAVGPHFIGSIGNLRVYLDPSYGENDFMIGYKGGNMFDAGYFYCPYMPIASTDLIMDANFRGQRGWATMYGKAKINSNMYVKGHITQ